MEEVTPENFRILSAVPQGSYSFGTIDVSIDIIFYCILYSSIGLAIHLFSDDCVKSLNQQSQHKTIYIIIYHAGLIIKYLSRMNQAVANDF